MESNYRPYRIWLSEIILQQTRVEQGLPYFEQVEEAYPTVMELAAADDEAVMKLGEAVSYKHLTLPTS